jgi:serine protease AprX
MPTKKQLPQERLPIKVILPKQAVEKKNLVKGGSNKPFRKVDNNYRTSLSRQVVTIKKSLSTQLSRMGAIPIKVKLISQATAKSHRPDNLFSEDTCPIIGSGKLGELYLKATDSGLDNLNLLITNNDSAYITKELSCVDFIEPMTSIARRNGINSADILRVSPRRNNFFVERVKLFDFGQDSVQESLVADFKKVCIENGIEFSSSGYKSSSLIYEVRCKNVNDIETLSNIIGVRSITQMPLIKTVRSSALNQQPPIKLPKREQGQDDIPVVVVVDSGVSSKNEDLESWVVGRISDVAPKYQNTFHGTFVGGLICFGGTLNPTVKGIDTNPCGVFDLQVIPNDDPQRGDISSLLESELLISLENALNQYADKYKVWNLSLGSDTICSLDEFSPLAEELDNLQEKYHVSFVISAGNYQTLPMLEYPRIKDQLLTGRITSPGDSVLGITVGAISHVDYNRNGPKEHNPSPFSRHGSGPNYIIKPDLVHYGGSCATDLSTISGIRSITENGSAEDLGTSYSTPLVSRSLAQIYHQVTPTPSPVLARALLTHHARDPRNGKRVPDGEENFFGFGLPTQVPTCLECNPYTSTLVFEDVLRPGYYLEWDDFPYPSSLQKNGKFFGEISMTIAHAPSRGARWGTEYCETHIEANFGIYFGQKNRKTGVITPKFKGLVPAEHKNPGILYESYQVEKLRKWAPVRTYHGRLDDKGERGDRWRLKLRLLTRHDIEQLSTFQPQPFALIVTISDPKQTAPVYDEMSIIIRNRFKNQNLSLRSTVRQELQQKVQGK